MPRLNNARNQAIWILNAGMSATVVLLHLGCTRTTIEHLQRRLSVTGNVAKGPRSGRPHVTTAANDHYIVLQHLCKQADCSSNQKTVWYSSTECQKSVEIKRSTYSWVLTVLRSNSHPTLSNGKTELVPPSPAFPTC